MCYIKAWEMHRGHTLPEKRYPCRNVSPLRGYLPPRIHRTGVHTPAWGMPSLRDWCFLRLRSV